MTGVQAGGAAHNAYFRALQAGLAEAGIAWPCVVVDRGRMRRNIERLRTRLQAGLHLRLAEKSLPVPALLAEAMERLDTQRLMVFDEPQLRHVAREFPACDVLLGKPLPVAAARHFLTRFDPGSFDPASQVQWLVDTPARLGQYAALAGELDVTLRISVEIDVGLHRGGVDSPGVLAGMLAEMRAPGSRLRFAGLMGYDAHVGKLPALVERRATSLARSRGRYHEFQEVVRAADPALAAAACWNGGGSPTVLLQDAESPLNEVAAGSLLVKPLAFDIPLLADFEPAIFIAAPVLKVLPGTRLPGPRWLSALLYAGRPGRARSYFIYGGGWPAEPVSPAGLRANAMFGLSFNQAILNGPRVPALAVDDLVFFRPWQSEGVLLQFGPVQVVEDGRVVSTWPPFGGIAP